MLTYFVLGAVIGAVTGIPIGPVNVAVIDAAYRHHLRRAIAVGLGGATADGLYAFLGIVGVGPLLMAHPTVQPILYSVSGVVLIAYGTLTARSQPVDPTAKAPKSLGENGWFWGGYGLGIALIFLNPATLILWVGVVGSEMAGASVLEGTAAALGVTVGSGCWFCLVAYLAEHGKRLLGKRAIWMTRIVGILLVCLGVFSVGRAVYYAIPFVALLADVPRLLSP